MAAVKGQQDKKNLKVGHFSRCQSSNFNHQHVTRTEHKRTKFKGGCKWYFSNKTKLLLITDQVPNSKWPPNSKWQKQMVPVNSLSIYIYMEC